MFQFNFMESKYLSHIYFFSCSRCWKIKRRVRAFREWFLVSDVRTVTRRTDGADAVMASSSSPDAAPRAVPIVNIRWATKVSYFIYFWCFASDRSECAHTVYISATIRCGGNVPTSTVFWNLPESFFDEYWWFQT